MLTSLLDISSTYSCICNILSSIWTNPSLQLERKDRKGKELYLSV